VIQFSKLMVEKVYEIRRQSPPELKSKIKMSSPALFEDLQTYYTGEQVGSLSKMKKMTRAPMTRQKAVKSFIEGKLPT